MSRSLFSASLISILTLLHSSSNAEQRLGHVRPKALPTYIVPEKTPPLKDGELAPAPKVRKSKIAGAASSQQLRPGQAVTMKKVDAKRIPTPQPKK
jgi:hypothetical protein